MSRDDIPNVTVKRPTPIKISKAKIRRRRLVAGLSLAPERFRILWKNLVKTINEKRFRNPQQSSRHPTTRSNPDHVKNQKEPRPSQQALVLGLEVPDSSIQAICGYCMQDVPEFGSNSSNGLKRLVCSQCGCIQHYECWEIYGGCVALGSPH